jgi:hypothetical protein
MATTTTRCPDCSAPGEPYEGPNEHKAGTGICPTHGRVRIYREPIRVAITMARKARRMLEVKP